MNKVYLNKRDHPSPNLLKNIKKIENELLSEYTSTLEEKDKQLLSTYSKLQKI
jgi:succinate dehydrogenase flavin-adding protein (antitoxin of CptAB toxin-antitoxin module)